MIFPFMALVLLYDKHEAIRNQNKTYLRRFGTMYQDFKTNKEWYMVQYYPIFMIRRLVFVIFIVVLIDYPEIQCNCFILFSCLVSSFSQI